MPAVPKPEKRRRRRKRWRKKPRDEPSPSFKRRFHSRERVLWIKAQPCVVTGIVDPEGGRIENAHVVPRSAGGTYDNIVPLHRKLHRYLDVTLRRVKALHWKKAVERFNEEHGVDLLEEARKIEERWQAHCLQPKEEARLCGARIGPGARVDADTVIGAGTVIGKGAYIDAGVVVGEGAYIGPSVEVAEGVRIAEGKVTSTEGETG